MREEFGMYKKQIKKIDKRLKEIKEGKVKAYSEDDFFYFIETGQLPSRITNTIILIFSVIGIILSTIGIIMLFIKIVK